MRVDRRCSNPESGWTFVESIIVIAIIIILSGTMAFSAVRYVDRARRAATRAQVATVRLALHAYFLDTGAYPTQAQGLDALWECPVLAPVPTGWSGPYVDGPVTSDSWGRSLEYRVPGSGGLPFDVLSFGADGLPGGSGNDADVTSTG
jgi:general secretion pathway protein G